MSIEQAVDNDELTAFIASALKAIAAGVNDASDASRQNSQTGFNTFSMPEKVAFDVAVSAKRVSESGGGLKVQVFSVGANIKGSQEVASESISRITFEVPWGHTRTAPLQPSTIPKTQTAWNK